MPENAEGFDTGCGSGRWAELILSGKYADIAKLNCVDPSDAIEVAKNKLSKFQNAAFYNITINDMPLENLTQDFGYCLGGLHHIPDTLSAMKVCVDKLKPGAPFLVYMYYNFEKIDCGGLN